MTLFAKTEIFVPLWDRGPHPISNEMGFCLVEPVWLGYFLRYYTSTTNRNIAKGTMDHRVEFISQDHSSQFTNLEHITISESRLSINFNSSEIFWVLSQRWYQAHQSLHYGLRNKKEQKDGKSKPPFLIHKKLPIHICCTFWVPHVPYLPQKKVGWLLCRKFDQNYNQCKKGWRRPQLATIFWRMKKSSK